MLRIDNFNGIPYGIAVSTIVKVTVQGAEGKRRAKERQVGRGGGGGVDARAYKKRVLRVCASLRVHRGAQLRGGERVPRFTQAPGMTGRDDSVRG